MYVHYECTYISSIAPARFSKK